MGKWAKRGGRREEGGGSQADNVNNEVYDTGHLQRECTGRAPTRRKGGGGITKHPENTVITIATKSRPKASAKHKHAPPHLHLHLRHSIHERRVSPAQKPDATPSTPKSPKRVSLSSSVPYIVRFICAPGVSGGRGNVPLMPSCIPTSVLDTVRRGMNAARRSELSVIATLGTLGEASGSDSGTSRSMEAAVGAVDSTAQLLSIAAPELLGPA